MTREQFYKIVDAITPNQRGCKIWPATYEGYRRILINGQMKKVHRLAYERYKPIGPGKLICHKCDEKGCVEITHLYQGTSSDNLRDTFERNTKYRQGFLERVQELAKTPEHRERARQIGEKYGNSPENIERLITMNQSPEHIDRVRIANQKPENIERRKQIGKRCGEITAKRRREEREKHLKWVEEMLKNHQV
jgi:hypothetical protein